MLFNKQNKKQIDPRYFLKETILKEAPTEKQVNRLANAMEKLFGGNCLMGQGAEGGSQFISIKDANGQWHNFKPMSGAYSKAKTQPAMFMKGGEGAEQCAYIMLQNAEQMERIMMPVIKKIFSLAGEDLNKEDTKFATNDSPSVLDNQEEITKLRKENQELKKKIEELESRLSGKETKKKSGSSKWSSTDLEIDQ